MYSHASPDPIGIVLSWLPIALALFGAVLAIAPSAHMLVAEVKARRHGGPAAPVAEPQPA